MGFWLHLVTFFAYDYHALLAHDMTSRQIMSCNRTTHVDVVSENCAHARVDGRTSWRMLARTIDVSENRTKCRLQPKSDMSKPIVF